MHPSSSKAQPASEPALLPQYGFGAAYTFDALVDLHPFLYRVHTPKHHGHNTSSLSPSRAASPFRPALSRSPSSLSASIASIRSTGSTETDIDDAAPGDPYFLSRRFRNDLSSPDPGTRCRTLSTLSSLSGGSASGSYTYVDSEYDFSDAESEAGTAVLRAGLTRSTSMMFSPARRRVESLTAVRPGHKRSMSVGQVIRPVPPSPLKHVGDTLSEPEPAPETGGAQMTYADLVKHLDWTTRAHSPYVTTSFSFFWALWEAVRRYRLGVKHDVEIAVIDARRLRDRARTALEVLRGVEGERQDKAYWKWYRFALEAQDVLVFGAIPGDAIYASIPLTQLLPMLPDYFFRADPSISVPSSLSSSLELQPASQTEPAELDEDPRSPTARQAHPLFFPSTPVRMGTAPSTPSLTTSQKLERASTAILFTTLAWDIGTSLKPLRRSSKSTSISASPGKEKRHTSHRDFCHALTQAFLSPARTHDGRVNDATEGVVRLAEVLLGPWVRARCAEGAARDAFGMGDEEEEDEDEEDEDELDRSMSSSFFGERAGSECLGLAGDGCTLEHSHHHATFPSISSSPSASLNADADAPYTDSHAATAQHDAASVLSELADALARWPAAWWAAEHAEEVVPRRAEAARRCVAEAVGRMGVGIGREQGRVSVGRRGSVGSVGIGNASTYEKWALTDDGDDDERRGRGVQKVEVGLGASGKTKTRSLRGWPAHSPSHSHSPSPAPHRPRARSPLGTSPALLGPAIVLRSGGERREKDGEGEGMTDSFESDLSASVSVLREDEELARSKTDSLSPRGEVPQTRGSSARSEVETEAEAESVREKAWAPSTPPPTPPLHGASPETLRDEDASSEGRWSASQSQLQSQSQPPPPPPRSRRRPISFTVPVSGLVSTPESESGSGSGSMGEGERSLPGGWADAEGDESGNGNGSREGSRSDDDFFRSPTRTQVSARSQPQSQPQLFLQRRPFSWAGPASGAGAGVGAGTGGRGGGAEFPLSSSPLGGSRTSSVESLRGLGLGSGRGSPSPSLVPPGSGSPSSLLLPFVPSSSSSPSPSPMRSRTVSASRSRGPGAGSGSGPGPGQAALLGLEYVDARMGLLAEVVSSVLGVSPSSGSGSGSGELRLDTSTSTSTSLAAAAAADAQSLTQGQGQDQGQVAARPHGLVHHRRHSSQLEQELSPVREEMEDEGEGLGRGGVGVGEGEGEGDDGASEAAATEGGIVGEDENEDGDVEAEQDVDVGEPGSTSARAPALTAVEPSLDVDVDVDMAIPDGAGVGVAEGGEEDEDGEGDGLHPAPAMSHASRSRSATLESIPEEEWSIIDMPVSMPVLGGSGSGSLSLSGEVLRGDDDRAAQAQAQSNSNPFRTGTDSEHGEEAEADKACEPAEEGPSGRGRGRSDGVSSDSEPLLQLERAGNVSGRGVRGDGGAEEERHSSGSVALGDSVPEPGPEPGSTVLNVRLPVPSLRVSPVSVPESEPEPGLEPIAPAPTPGPAYREHPADADADAPRIPNPTPTPNSFSTFFRLPELNFGFGFGSDLLRVFKADAPASASASVAAASPVFEDDKKEKDAYTGSGSGIGAGAGIGAGIRTGTGTGTGTGADPSYGRARSGSWAMSCFVAGVMASLFLASVQRREVVVVSHFC